MAGTVMIAISNFGGIDMRGEQIKVDPKMPLHWKELTFSLTFKGVNYHFKINNNCVEILSDKDAELIIFNKKYQSQNNIKLLVTR